MIGTGRKEICRDTKQIFIMSNVIPLSEPCLEGNEWTFVKDCLDTGWVSSAGKYVKLFEDQIAEYTGAKHAVACMNGTVALQIALRLAGVSPGDEVLVPTLTFIASINAVTYNRAVPVFMDADNYYNLDISKTLQFIEEKTFMKEGASYNKNTGRKISAIIPVHVFGNAVGLAELLDVCRASSIEMVEDAAESLGTRYTEGVLSGKHTGTIGKTGCLSFNGNKIITTGGGGIILTNDTEISERARYLTTQAKDDPVRYIHNEIGYNFRMTNLQAAMGVAQLELLPGFIEKKHSIFKTYDSGFSESKILSLSAVPTFANCNYWMPALRIESEGAFDLRESLMAHLEAENIQSRPIWYPNHNQVMYKDHESYRIENATALWEQTLCLPSYPHMQGNEVARVLDTIMIWYRNHFN